METTTIIEEAIKLLPAAGAYVASLEIAKLVGQELIKENVKKFYGWVLGKFTSQKKEKDLTEFINTPESERLKGRVESTLETILEDEISKQELINLLNDAKPDLLILTIQKNEKNDNESSLDIGNISTPTKVKTQQENKEGKNKSEIKIGK